MSLETVAPPPRHYHGDNPVTNDDLDEALRIHSEEERDYYSKLMGEVLKAFPGGIEEHRNYHLAKAEAAKAEKEFWQTAKTEILRKGISGALHLLGVIVLLAAVGLFAKIGIALPFWGSK